MRSRNAGKGRDRNSRSVITTLIEQANRLPDERLKSLTWDRGKEMAEHKRFTLATDAAVYFCDPQSPLQRGSNENTNRLLRQYFPKGTNLAVHSQERLDEIARQLNQRPRKRSVTKRRQSALKHVLRRPTESAVESGH
jgi:IS30 family transposase